MLALQMTIYGYALLLLLLLLFDSRTNRRSLTKTAVLFRAVVLVTMVMLVVEAAALAVDRIPGRVLHWVAFIANSFQFIIILTPLTLWLTYLDEIILTSERGKKHKRIVYIAFNIAAIVIVIVNCFTGVLFTISAENVYSRGPAVLWLMVMNAVLFLGYLPSIRKYRKFINGRIYELILSLGALPFLGAAVQLSFYGTPLIWPMMALVALAAHTLVEKEEIRRDALTGLLSRIQMESRVQFLIDHRQPFSLILLDIDRFKSINDTYGHDEGDQALCVIANLLNKSIKQVDSAYRYAGDEFILIIESERMDAANRVLERLESNLEKCILANKKPYLLTFSSGVAFYDGVSVASVVGLFTLADERMYQNKHLRRGQSSGDEAALAQEGASLAMRQK